MKIEKEITKSCHNFNAYNPSKFTQFALRIFDILFSITGLILCSPILLVIALLIKVDSTGPVLYRQKRHGIHKKIFIILKFRTMTNSASQSTFRQATEDDTRVTKFGRFLRRSSLDELPQLFNVLIGDMSLVGPRPHPTELDAKFEDKIQGYKNRFNTKPGITGLAQIRGHRGPTETVEKMAARIQSDMEYTRNQSATQYIKIVFATFALLLFRPNAQGF